MADCEDCPDNPEIISNPTKECRVCLKMGEIPIFGDKSRPDISREVMSFGMIRISPKDNLPKSICEECNKLLQAAIQFRTAAKQSYLILNSRKSGKRRTLLPPKPWRKPLKQEKPFVNKRKTIEITEPAEPKPEFLSVTHCFKTDDVKDEVRDTNVPSEDDGLDDRDDNGDIEILIVSSEKHEKPYPCDVCNKEFQSLGEYELHSSCKEHRKLAFLDVSDSEQDTRKDLKAYKMVDCEICYKTLINRSSYNRHMKSVHKIIPVKCATLKRSDSDKEKVCCELCKGAISKPHYNRHLRHTHKIGKEINVTKKRRRECEICNKSVSALYYSRHKKYAHASSIDCKWKQKAQCPVCEKYYTEDFLKLHVEKHRLEESGCDTARFICDQCGKKFNWAATLKSHRLTHSNDLPYKCEFCPYRGRSKDLLRIHVRTHTGDYRHKCTQCSACYTTKSNLNKHLQRHRGAVDFLCDICKRGFYSKLDLERHIEVIHMGIKNHMCNICGMAFGYRRGMMKHQLKVHKRAKVLKGRLPLYMLIDNKSEVNNQTELNVT